MKAVQVSQYGGPEVILVNENAPEPAPNEGQVLVEVFATSINPFDIAVRSGALKDLVSVPYIPGGDFSGVIKAISNGVKEFQVGDEVFGSALILNGGSGSFAQITLAREKNIAKKPQKADFLEAGALPLVGASTVQAIENHINLKKGQRILIHGGGGGIGSIAIQLAKYLGAYVATTVSAVDLESAKKLGAYQVIDYTSQDFSEILKDFDAVFDTSGKETDKSFKVLKKGGVIVSMVGAPSAELAKQYQVLAIGQSTQTNSEHLKRVADLVDLGAIKARISKVFTLDRARQAFEYLEKDHPKGKVVLDIKTHK